MRIRAKHSQQRAAKTWAELTDQQQEDLWILLDPHMRDWVKPRKAWTLRKALRGKA